MSRRVIIAGSRSFDDANFMADVMGPLCDGWWLTDRDPAPFHVITVLSGRARGADRLGEQWAEHNGHAIETYPADWDKHGKAAGFIRNLEMARNADTLVAFWDGESQGTAHMIHSALAHGLEVHVYQYGDKDGRQKF